MEVNFCSDLIDRNLFIPLSRRQHFDGMGIEGAITIKKDDLSNFCDGRITS